MDKKEQLIVIGENIRKIRLSKGLSQDKLAFESNISRAYMGCLERGEQAMSILNLIKIAIALNIEVGEIFPTLNSLKE